MPQVKVDRTMPFTSLGNDVIQNPSLSLKAKGLLLYMLSLPMDWDYSLSGLASCCKEGMAAIRAAIHELEQTGHVVRQQARGSDGRMSTSEYLVRAIVPPSCENRTTVEASPSCDFPTTDNPTSENHTEQNKYTTNEILNKPPIVPHEGTTIPRVSQPKWHPEWFNPLYDFYPNHKARQDACRAWDRLKPDRDFCRMMYEAVRVQKRSVQWLEDNGKYIPQFSRWLNGEKWNDEVRLAPGYEGGGGSWADDPEVT